MQYVFHKNKYDEWLKQAALNGHKSVFSRNTFWVCPLARCLHLHFRNCQIKNCPHWNNILPVIITTHVKTIRDRCYVENIHNIRMHTRPHHAQSQNTQWLASLHRNRTLTYPELSNSHTADDEVYSIDNVLCLIVIERRNETETKILPHAIHGANLQHVTVEKRIISNVFVETWHIHSK